MPSRRSSYEVVINTHLPRVIVKPRTAVTVVHAPSWHEAAVKLLELTEGK